MTSRAGQGFPVRRRRNARRGLAGTPPLDRWYGQEAIDHAHRELLACGELAERLGYDSFWLTEHHFQHEGYEVVPNGLLFSAFLAARTTRLRIGTMFNIVGQWHPLRLAEDFAMLHNLSGGRGILGVGRGTVPREMLPLTAGRVAARSRAACSLRAAAAARLAAASSALTPAATATWAPVDQASAITATAQAGRQPGAPRSTRTDPAVIASRALCLHLAGTIIAERPLTGMCDSARCPQATHRASHRPVWAEHAERTKTVLGQLGNTRAAERTRLTADYDRAMRVIAQIDARTAFYGTRPYACLRAEFELRPHALQQAGERPDPRDAQIARLKNEITALKERLAQSASVNDELAGFRAQALARLAAQHDEIIRLRRHATGTANVRQMPDRIPGTRPCG